MPLFCTVTHPAPILLRSPRNTHYRAINMIDDDNEIDGIRPQDSKETTVKTQLYL